MTDVFGMPETRLREAVRAERKRRRWTQQDLSDRVAHATETWDEPCILHQNGVTRLETGHRGISLNEAYALCHVLDIDLAELIDLAGPPAFLRAARDRRVRAAKLLDIVESVFAAPAIEE